MATLPASPMNIAGGGAALARLAALVVPLGLLGGALFSQYVGGLHPCELCYLQRWPHAAAILLAGGAFAFSPSDERARALVTAAALAVALSGAIGVFHAGVELHWWQGQTQCTSNGAMSLDDILGAPVIRCDEIQWSLAGLSMAGWNALISLVSALAIAVLLRKAR